MGDAIIAWKNLDYIFCYSILKTLQTLGAMFRFVYKASIWSKQRVGGAEIIHDG